MVVDSDDGGNDAVQSRIQLSLFSLDAGRRARISITAGLSDGKPMGAVSVFMVGNYLNQPSEFLSALHDVVASCVVLRLSLC